MATKRTLILNAKDTNNKALSTSFNYVNPESTAAVCVGFTQKMNSLTTNTYVSTEQKDVTDLDELVEGEGE